MGGLIVVWLHGEQLDEGLTVLDGLWSGEPFSFSGAHYQIAETQFLPQPVQQPRVPIWVGAGWPRKRPIERAARWDGIVPFKHGGSLTPNDYRAMIATIQAHRHDDAPFDTVCYATTVAADGVVDDAVIAEFAQAGVTWWLEGLDMNLDQQLSEVIERVRQGPPRLR